jgi:hypothetical protein
MEEDCTPLNFGIFILVVIGVLLVSYWIAGLTSELTGVALGTIFAWEVGIIGGLLFTVIIIATPIGRLCLIVTASAVILIMIFQASFGVDDERMNSFWVKTLVIGPSMGLGGLYLFWELRRGGLE